MPTSIAIAAIAAGVATGVGIAAETIAVSAAAAFFAQTFATSLILGGVGNQLSKPRAQLN
jgi:hypothetical protein